jgi:class 3 adenylate cyclase
MPIETRIGVNTGEVVVRSITVRRQNLLDKSAVKLREGLVHLG